MPRPLAARFARECANGLDHVGDILIAHRGEDRQREATAVNLFGDGEIAGVVAIALLVEVHRVERDAVDGIADAAHSEHINELIAIDLERGRLQADHVQVPGVLDTALGDGDLQRVIAGEGLVVSVSDCLAGG